MVSASVSNGTWAIVYARRGWPVFPVWWIEDGNCACQKYGGDYCKSQGCEEGNWGKHMVVDPSIGMTSWIKHATSDEAMIREIWGRYPRAGIGFEPGSVGLIAFDVDPRHGGDVSLEDWEKFNSLGEDGGPLWIPTTMTAYSGGGGYHYICKADVGASCQSMNNWLPGVDVKSRGGYIVLPPSEHRSGNRYRWSDETQEPAPIDPRIVASVGSSVTASRSGWSGGGSGQKLTRSTDDILRNGFPEGGVGDPDGLGRDEGLFKLAGRLRRQMGPNSHVEVTRMVQDAARHCRPPFPDSAAEAKVRSAFSYPLEVLNLRELWPNFDDPLPSPAASASAALTPVSAPPAETPAAGVPEPLTPVEVVQERSSWAPMDVSDYTAGKRTARMPEYLEREDEKLAFYPGRINEVHGASESLKTWLVLMAVRDALHGGYRVVYVDFENGPEEIISRLMALGNVKAEIDDRFLYRQPEEPIVGASEKVIADVRAMIQDEGADVTVIDGLNEALALNGLSPDKADEVLILKQKLLQPIAGAGAAVVLIDHTSKSGDTGFATGSQQKKALVTGCGFYVELVSPFGRGMTGTASLEVTKDRPGWVRPDCDPEKMWGTLILVSDSVTGAIETRIQVPASTLFSKTLVLEAKCVKLLAWMNLNTGTHGKTEIQKGAKMKSSDVTMALGQLEAEGRIKNEGSSDRQKWNVV